MENEHVLSGLIRKRAEIAGQLVQAVLGELVSRIRDSLFHGKKQGLKTQSPIIAGFSAEKDLRSSLLGLQFPTILNRETR